MPNIYAFDSASEFLRDFYQLKKMGNPGWSLSVWCRILGVDSKSTLSKVLAGDRKIGTSLEIKLLRYLALPPQEELIFKLLVRLGGREQDKDVREVLVKEINRLRMMNGKPSPMR